MNRDKRFIALMAAVVLCFALCMGVFAAGGDHIASLENGVLTLKADFANGVIPMDTLSERSDFNVLVIPEGISTINTFAIQSCANIDTLYLPASITKIASNAFLGCGTITAVHYAGNSKSDIDLGNENCFKNATWIYVSSPSDSVELSFSIADVSVKEGETASMSLVLDTPCTGLAATLKISAADGDGNALRLLSAAPAVTLLGVANNELDGTLVIATAEAIPAGTAVATFSFACPEAGEYTVTITGEMFSGNNAPADFSISGGKITVKEPDVLISWLNHDGSLIKSERVSVGSTPSYSGETPTKAATDTHTYSFSGWDKTPAAVNTDTEYTAQFTESVRSYALSISCDTEGVTFTLMQGSTEIIPNADGSYTLSATGSYTITADAIGYKEASRTVTIADWILDTDKSTASYTFPALEEFTGDVDDDEDIDAADAQALFNYLAGNLSAQTGAYVHPESGIYFYPAAADVNGSGKVETGDILPLLRLINEQG